jgi:rhomboid family protein
VGGLASVATHPHAVSSGASGAVFGVFGAFTAVMFVRRGQSDPGAWQRTMRSLGTFFAINVMFGLNQRTMLLRREEGQLVMTRPVDSSARAGGPGLSRVGREQVKQALPPSSTRAASPAPWLRGRRLEPLPLHDRVRALQSRIAQR